MAAPLELFYFDAKGKGEAIRLICHYTGTELKDTRLSYESFLKMKAEATVLKFGQMPCLLVDGKTPLCQSAAIMRYLGKQTGLYPTNNLEAAFVDALVDQEADLFGGLTTSTYPARFGFGSLDAAGIATVRKALNDETVPRHLGFFEKILGSSSSGWIAGGACPSIVDFIMGPRLEYLTGGLDGISKDILTPFPNVAAFVTKFFSNPKIASYYTKVPSFIATKFTSRTEYDEWVAGGAVEVTAAPVKKPVKAAAPFDPNKWAEEPKKMPKEVQEAYRTYSDDGSFGKVAPALDTLEWIKGDAVAYSSEKPTVVVFWAKFAKGDYTTIVGVSDIFDDFKEQAQFIGISLDPVVDDAKSFLKKIGTAMPELDVKKCVVPYSLAFDTGKTVKEAFRTTSGLMSLTASACFIIDVKGKILWREQFGQGYAPKKGQLREQLRRHCAGEGLLSNGKKPVVEDSDEDLADGDMDCDYDSDLGF